LKYDADTIRKLAKERSHDPKSLRDERFRRSG